MIILSLPMRLLFRLIVNEESYMNLDSPHDKSIMLSLSLLFFEKSIANDEREEIPGVLITFFN